MPRPKLTLRQLNRATLARQGLLEPLDGSDAAVLVERIGSLQAQHPAWPPFALQSRMSSGGPVVDLYRARMERTVVRASLMRMTAHVVSAADFWPMSILTRGFRLDQWRILFKVDPTDSRLARRIRGAHPAAVAALREQPLSAREIEGVLAAEIGRARIPPNRCLWRHFLGSVPLVYVPYPEESYGRTRYALAEDWLGLPPDANEALAPARLIRRYLGAFGPASVDDLAAYVGRGRDTRRWRAAIQDQVADLVTFTDETGRTLFDLSDAPRPAADTPAPPRLLARWDSLLLAYGTAHRTRVLAEAHRTTVITRNADVLPTFLVDGHVAGTWLPRRATDGTTGIELRPLGRLSATTRDALEAEADRLLPLLASGAYSRYPGTD